MNQETVKWIVNSPVARAWAEGKNIEICLNGKWSLCSDYYSADDKAGILRVKPTPTLRPWKPEEVPVGALLRQKGFTSIALIIAQSRGDIICFAHGQSDYRETVKEALETEEHSLDHGKTWLPCGVEE